MTAGVCIPRTRSWEVHPGGDPGRAVQVFLAWPEPPPPAAGYPALFVLDAPVLFGTVVEAARLQAGRPAATGVVPGLVVGLGHGGDRAAQVAARRRDYTPPPFDPQTATGGADAFLHAVESLVLPTVEQWVPIDRMAMALFGHSIAGLLPVHALLARPGLFGRCVAASPSLWWGDGVLLRRARAFAAAGGPSASGSRLLLTVGGLERPDSEAALRDPVRAARLHAARMIGNVQDLAAALSPVLLTRCVEFPDENHGSVVPAAISRAIPFALGGRS